MKESINTAKLMGQLPSTLRLRALGLKKEEDKQREVRSESLVEEEILAAFLYAQNNKQSHKNKIHDENEVAYAVEIWKEKGRIPGDLYEPALLQEAANTMLAEAKMQADPESHSSLPQGLRHKLELSLAKLEKKQERQRSAKPSIIVELLQDSIKVIKSSLNGFGDVFQPLVQTRGLEKARPLFEKPANEDGNFLDIMSKEAKSFHLKANYAMLRQRIKEQHLRYELTRDSNDSINLLIVAPECLRKSKAVLKRDGYIIETQSFNAENGLLKFKRLEVGRYNLGFHGMMEYNVDLDIRFPLRKVKT